MATDVVFHGILLGGAGTVRHRCGRAQILYHAAGASLNLPAQLVLTWLVPWAPRREVEFSRGENPAGVRIS